MSKLKQVVLSQTNKKQIKTTILKNKVNCKIIKVNQIQRNQSKIRKNYCSKAFRINKLKSKRNY